MREAGWIDETTVSNDLKMNMQTDCHKAVWSYPSDNLIFAHEIGWLHVVSL